MPRPTGGACSPRQALGPEGANGLCHLVFSPLPHCKPQFLPVQDFIPALHIKSEVRKGNWDRTVFPSNEVPGSVVSHLLSFFSVLPAPLTLLIPGELEQSGQGPWTKAIGYRAALGRAMLTSSAYWFWSVRRPNPQWLAPIQTLAYIQWRYST